MNILEVENLQVRYRVGRRRVEAVRGIDLSVPRGGIVALVGESGSGKSSVSQALIRRLAANGEIVGGSVCFDGQDLLKLPMKRMRSIRGGAIGFVPQDPNSSLNPTLRIGEQLVEGLRLHLRLGREEAAERAVRILGDVGLSHPEARARQYPHELSGGMKQRVLIGMAWSCDPQLVIADEPTSALDVTVQRLVLDQMQQLASDRGTAVLMVTHDLGVAADRAEQVVVMRHGEVVDAGPTSAVLHAPTHEYTRDLVAAAPGLNSVRLSASAPSSAQAEPPHPLLEIRDLRKTFSLRRPGAAPEPFTAVDGVSLTVPAGRTVALVGESGSGKTTTARMAARIGTADSGSVLLDGRDVTTLTGDPLRQLRRDVQVVYQNPFGSLDPRLSVARIIAEPLRAFGIGGRREQQRTALELLDSVQLAQTLADRRPAELSGGQRQRVAIARALALSPRLLVLDEPVSALDVSVQQQVLQLLVDLKAERGVGYLFITHDFGVVRQIADEVVVMRQGRVVEQGPAERLLGTPDHEYTRALLEAVPGAAAR
ncbi:dipeptide ABC transporter ATP-binding protein [Arenivirga flava]|uniref:ABC transporter ATP-binding protein n=1 Tax=Arenivirga flava TaxID=1930060 RepID=A0AA37UHQ2_9MICO|nr:ABC transporter ATP-binding protein [Arenivirga flava]GMA28076.1 ABC transporter ATP-binding protein [Arenivirga flava]